jgi:hypothetical protein
MNSAWAENSERQYSASRHVHNHKRRKLCGQDLSIKQLSIISTYIVLKNSIPTSEQTHSVSIIRTERLELNNETNARAVLNK